MLPSNRTDLKPRIHWHWKSFASKFSKLSVLVGLSGHIFSALEFRRAHETFLDHKVEALLILTPERSHWDSTNGGKCISEGEMSRIVASHADLRFPWKEGHVKHASKKISER